MSEESVLILNMLREGKVTAEQADSLLRAVRETSAAPAAPPAAPASPIPPLPPAPPSPDPAAMAAMQAKLAELQNKLGDLQGKLGAAQTTRGADYASALAGKIIDSLPRPEIDMSKINKAVDEAMRGLSSLKSDAVRTARAAARQAAQEGRKASREGRKAFKFEINIDLGGGAAGDRPENDGGEPEEVQSSRENITWTGAETLALDNKYGNITIIGGDLPPGTAEATVTKTAWAASDAEARVLLQQVFLTNQVENGQCKVGIAAPVDASQRLTVDYEIRVPRTAALLISTTFGDVSAEGVSSALTVQSASGEVTAARPWAEAPGETKLGSRSGSVRVTDWNAPSGTLSVETNSGEIEAANVSTQSATLTSRSGDLEASGIQASGAALFESASGDVSVAECRVGTKAQVRTQSGAAHLSQVHGEQVHVETVSGDAEVRQVTGTLTIKTVSGDVEASDADSPAISLVTVSGDAEWRIPAPFSGSFAGTTVSGDLTLTLPPVSDVRLEMNTTTGSLALKLPVSGLIQTDRHAAGTLGAGTGSVRLQSVSGDLKIAETK